MMQAKSERLGNFLLSREVAISYGNVPTVTDPAERLRYNVRRLFEAQGKSMAGLAKHVGKSRPWISQILSGRRATTMKTLSDIQSFFGVDVSELFASVPIKDQKGPLNTKDVSLPDTPSGVTSALPNEGVSAHAVSSQADPLQFRAELQRTYDEVDVAIEGLTRVRIQLAGLLGPAGDREQLAGVEPPEARVGGVSQRRGREAAEGREKDAPVRRTGVR